MYILLEMAIFKSIKELFKALKTKYETKKLENKLLRETSLAAKAAKRLDEQKIYNNYNLYDKRVKIILSEIRKEIEEIESELLNCENEIDEDITPEHKLKNKECPF